MTAHSAAELAAELEAMHAADPPHAYGSDRALLLSAAAALREQARIIDCGGNGGVHLPGCWQALQPATDVPLGPPLRFDGFGASDDMFGVCYDAAIRIARRLILRLDRVTKGSDDE